VVRVSLYHPVEQAFWRALGATGADFPPTPGYQWMHVRI
jgi:hypothetical protein